MELTNQLERKKVGSHFFFFRVVVCNNLGQNGSSVYIQEDLQSLQMLCLNIQLFFFLFLSFFVSYYVTMHHKELLTGHETGSIHYWSPYIWSTSSNKAISERIGYFCVITIIVVNNTCHHLGFQLAWVGSIMKLKPFFWLSDDNELYSTAGPMFIFPFALSIWDL